MSVSESDQAEFASEISASPPASQPCLHSTENSPNMAANNETVKHKDVASSGQVAEEHTEESQGQENTDPYFQTLPQSPTASKPDNSNASTFQESPESAHAVSDQE